MGLVGVVIRGVLESIAVLVVGPWPRTGIFCLWVLLLVWIKFHSSVGSMTSTVTPSVCDRGLDFPSHPTKLGLQRKCDKIYGNPMVL